MICLIRGDAVYTYSSFFPFISIGGAIISSFYEGLVIC